MPRRIASSQSGSKPSQSQSSSQNDSIEWSSQASVSTQTNLTAKQLERVTADLVTYLLIASQKNYAIKRQDILKHVIKEYARSYGQILEATRTRLLKVFGIRLVELKGKRGFYMLVNKFDQKPENMHMFFTESENVQMGLLTIVLTIIFMNGNSIMEGELFNALKKLNVAFDQPHPKFGDVHKLLTKEFVRQLYLEYRRIPNSDPVTFEFLWGPRANEEVAKTDLLDFASQVYGLDAKQWKSQYKDATEGAVQ